MTEADVLAGDEPSSRLARSLLEALAAHLGMSEGRWRAELVFEDGRYRELTRTHQRIPGTAVERGFAEADTWPPPPPPPPPPPVRLPPGEEELGG